MFYQGYWIPDDLVNNAGGGSPYGYDASASSGGVPGGYPDLSQLPTGNPGSGFGGNGIPIVNSFPTNLGGDPTQGGYGVGFSTTVTGTAPSSGGSMGMTYFPYSSTSTPVNSEYGGVLQPGQSAETPTPTLPGIGPGRTTPGSTNNTTNVSQNTAIGLPSNVYENKIPDVPKFQYNPISLPTPGRGQSMPLPSSPSKPESTAAEVQQVKAPGSPSVRFGSPQGSSSDQGSGAGGGSILGKIARIAAKAVGLNQVPPAYRGLYDTVKPKKQLTPEQLANQGLARAYADTYGLEE